MMTRQWCLVKGNLYDAYRAARRYGFTLRVWIPASTNHRFPETCVVATGTWAGIVDWMTADRTAPFPPGALMYHRELEGK